LTVPLVAAQDLPQANIFVRGWRRAMGMFGK
jgi:hypothetical protein